MTLKEVKVVNKIGIHAKYATKLVQQASSYNSKILLEFNNRKANAKDLISVLSLNIRYGDTFNILVFGKDAENICDALAKYIESFED